MFIAMIELELTLKKHDVKIGQKCGVIEPNINEDCIFISEGEPIGFFIKSIQGKLKQYIEIANKELRSKNVPKVKMARGVSREMMIKGIKNELSQYSTIIVAVPKKPQFRHASDFSNQQFFMQKCIKLFSKTLEKYVAH